jgi:hypothetical protein
MTPSKAASSNEQLLGIAELELDRRPQVLRKIARRRQQFARDVDAGHAGAGARDVARRPAGAGGDVEDAFAGARVEPLRRMLERIRDCEAHVVVVLAAAIPHGRGSVVVRENDVINGLHGGGFLFVPVA